VRQSAFCQKTKIVQKLQIYIFEKKLKWQTDEYFGEKKLVLQAF
jgi:hypothetical protein